MKHELTIQRYIFHDDYIRTCLMILELSCPRLVVGLLDCLGALDGEAGTTVQPCMMQVQRDKRRLRGKTVCVENF
jgi:hypothetical protein